MTPVESRSSSGSPQRSGSWVPSVVVLYRRTRGMPASRSASNPAPMASRVAPSNAASRAASMPNCSTTSKGACLPASLMTSASRSMVSNVGLAPSSPLTSRVMCMSTIRWRYRRGMVSMNCCPSRIRATFSSSNTRSTPGRPSAAPVTTTGSLTAVTSGRATTVEASPLNTRSPCSSTPANRRPNSV